ncbi:MAG: M48 family metallopeptidase [Bacteroidota bacterium]|nr:M48 family metallopeptidase [Bacteroidota bacterium]
MGTTILWIIIGILIFDFAFEQILDYLNTSRWSDKVPNALKDIIDEKKYKKSKHYYKTNGRFSLIISTISLIGMLAMLYFNGFAFVDGIVRNWTKSPVLMALLFFGVLGLVSDIITTPFSLYKTFVIEEKFGFNKTTLKTFFLDKIKGWLIGAIIGGGLLALIVWIYESTGNMFWIIAWAVMSLFTIFVTMFYTSLIVPLFNKLTPLEDGELRDEIETFAKKVGYKLDNIFIIDGSKRSSKANAYFSGLGSKKKIVLFDTLIKDHTKEELVGVLAHEIGHYKKRHTLANVILATLQTGLMLFILSFFIDKNTMWPQYLANALGSKEAGFHLGILAFGMLYSPLSLVLGIIMNIISRKNEFAADKFAAENYDGKPLQDALKKLSVNHLSNLNPHPAYVFVHYSHPPLLQRLKGIEENNCIS